MSIVSGYRGIIAVDNTTIEQINIKSSLFSLMRSDVTFNLVSLRDITRDTDSSARILSIESESNVSITNSEFYDISFSLISATDSSLKISDTYIQNITAVQYIIE